jgi:hypothetical protein
MPNTKDKQSIKHTQRLNHPKEVAEVAKKIEAKMSLQQNVMVFVPATATTKGYTIKCSLETAQSKCAGFKQIPIP